MIGIATLANFLLAQLDPDQVERLNEIVEPAQETVQAVGDSLNGGVAEAAEAFAEAAEVAEAGGFGLNGDILGSNVVNILLIVALVVYLGRNVIGKTLQDRRASIVAALSDAEERQQKASAALADQQQKLAAAQTEAAEIRKRAEASAENARQEIMAQIERDIARLQAAAQREIASEEERVMSQLRQQLVKQALDQVTSELPAQLTEDVQGRLIDSSIQLLGGQ